MPCKSTRTLIHHFTSSPLLQKRKPQGHGQRQATHQGRQHPKEAHHSRVSFLLTCLLLSRVISCFTPSLFSPALICFLKKSLGPKKRLSTSPLTPPSKQRTPRQNRGSTTSYAAAFGIWSMTSGTSPLAARPNANVAWPWRRW